MSSWNPTKANVGNNWNLPWMWIEMKSWTYFEWSKSKNLDSVICTIASSHLPPVINNTCSSLVAMESRRKPDFWIVDFEWRALQWTLPIGEMMTSAIWQFPHTFWNGGIIKLAMDNTPITLTKKLLKQKGKWTWTKGECENRCINKERKKIMYTHTNNM